LKVQNGSTDKSPERPVYRAEQASGGEIILRKRWQRAVFISGLVGAVLLALLLAILAIQFFR
jgi:hypothetical protein